MTNNERLDLAKWIAEFAQKSGADDTAVSITNQRDIEVEMREKKLENLKESTQNSLDLRIYAGGRYSTHSTSDLRKERLKPFIKEAVVSTKYLNEDKFRTLPDPKYYPKTPKKMNLADDAYEKIESTQRVDLASEIEKTALDKSDQIISVSAGCGDTYYESVLVHSNGFAGQDKGTVFWASASVTVKDGERGRPQDYSVGVSRFYKDLPDPKNIADEAVQRALQKAGQTKIESGVYTVLVENRAMSRLLGVLQGPLGARALQQKRSYLEGKIGQKIASDKLTIIDDPFVEKGLGSRYYDGEGLASRKRAIIDKGVLKEYFIDSYYGKKLGMEPNNGSTSNLVFDTGSRSLEEMTKSIERGILITGFIGGNSNDTTGDFSFGIVGQLIENGKITQAINEMNISENSKEFWNKLAETGNDPYPYSSWQRPSMLFEGVQLSGI